MNLYTRVREIIVSFEFRKINNYGRGSVHREVGNSRNYSEIQTTSPDHLLSASSGRTTPFDDQGEGEVSRLLLLLYFVGCFGVCPNFSYGRQTKCRLGT